MVTKILLIASLIANGFQLAAILRAKRRPAELLPDPAFPAPHARRERAGD